MLVAAAVTRRAQALRPQRPLKGLDRFSRLMARWLPAYRGPVRLAGNTVMTIDSRQPAERWLLFAGNYQPALTAFLKRHTPPGGIALDVGANLGFYTLQFARWVGPQGRVAAFEANPALVTRIRGDLAANGFDHVAVIADPVHARIEPVSFYIAPNAGKSSIHARQVSAPVQTIACTATTIDATAAAQGWERLDIIKIDIEGNDCNALLGARDTLARFLPVIVFEYWYSTPPDVAEPAFALLDRLGYRLEALQRNGQRGPFAPGRPAARLQHVDVIGLPK